MALYKCALTDWLCEVVNNPFISQRSNANGNNRKLQHSKLQKLQVNTTKGITGKNEKVTLKVLMFWCNTLAYSYLNKHCSTNERLYRLRWHCGKAKRWQEWQSFMGRIFAGGNNWWIQCSLLLASFWNRYTSTSCKKSDEHFSSQLLPQRTAFFRQLNKKWK